MHDRPSPVKIDTAMVDTLSTEHRSWNMSRIKNRDTKPEVLVRSIVYRLGLRYRLNDKTLPGSPDIVLRRHRTVIFVHGCFWHRHTKCKFAYTPKSRQEFWLAKFDENLRRDRRARRCLTALNWRIITVWECEVGEPSRLQEK